MYHHQSTNLSAVRSDRDGYRSISRLRLPSRCLNCQAQFFNLEDHYFFPRHLPASRSLQILLRSLGIAQHSLISSQPGLAYHNSTNPSHPGIMSRNPYQDYAGPSSSLNPDYLNQQDNRRDRSHWLSEEGQHQSSRGNLMEKSTPHTSSQGYEPSILSNASNSRSNSPHQPWVHRGSAQYSESGSSLPSYHDNGDMRYQDTPKATTSFRTQLDSGNRARVYLFVAMCGGMLLIFLFAALIWLKLDIVKKKPVYGLDNKVDYTVRSTTVV